MGMQTGENEQSMRKILDMTRLISIVILVIHFYFYCYAACVQWGFTASITDRFMGNISKTGLFDSFHKSKLIALGFLLISLLGAKGRKNEKLSYQTSFCYLGAGLVFYFFSRLLLLLQIKITDLALLYISGTSAGFLLILTGGTLLSRIIKSRLNNTDIFNRENETFPQEERKIYNDLN